MEKIAHAFLYLLKNRNLFDNSSRAVYLGGKERIRMIVESGDWCKKYSNFIIQEVIDKCPKTKEPSFKGCYGSGCEYRTLATKINDIVYLRKR